MTDESNTTDNLAAGVDAKASRDPSVILPGDLSERLRACRARAEMDVEHAAKEMRLSSALINALEAEKFEELPDPPYVRGYLRSYARLDASDPQELIDAYEALRGSKQQNALHAPSPDQAIHQRHLKDRREQRNPRPRISPTNLRLFGLAAVVLALAVFSMIPSVADWTKTTWDNFSERTSTTRHTAAAANSARINAQQAQNNPSTSTEVASADNSLQSPSSNTASTADTAQIDNNRLALASSNDTEATNQASTALALPAQDNTNTATNQDTTLAATPNSTDTTMSVEDTAADISVSTDRSGSTDTTSSETVEPQTETVVARADTNPSSTVSRNNADASQVTTQTTANEANTNRTRAQNTTTTTTTAVGNAVVNTVQDPSRSMPQHLNQQPRTIATRQQPIDGPVRVRMEFVQDVWMQVSDGNNRVLFEALNTANTWKEFRTRTPLKFKVGNASAVRIYLNGQLYDQRPHTRGTVSNFTVY